MAYQFDTTTTEEFEKLKDAIALITILVAGADENIDQEETEWAEKLTKIRSYANEDTLHEYYKEVGMDFQTKLSHYIVSLSADVDERTKQIEQKLADLNPILVKLPNEIGSALYSSYLSFAKHVAKSSGGFLGFGSISARESSVIDLSTIEPILYIEEEE